MDAIGPQRLDHRARELPGDMAHELRGHRHDGIAELSGGIMAQELRDDRYGDGVRGLPG